MANNGLGWVMLHPVRRADFAQGLSGRGAENKLAGRA